MERLYEKTTLTNGGKILLEKVRLLVLLEGWLHLNYKPRPDCRGRKENFQNANLLLETHLTLP